MFKRPAVLIPGLLVVYVGVAMLVLLAMPGARGPFEYLVAGAFATGVCLMIGFGLYIKTTMGRKNGR